VGAQGKLGPMRADELQARDVIETGGAAVTVWSVSRMPGGLIRVRCCDALGTTGEPRGRTYGVDWAPTTEVKVLRRAPRGGRARRAWVAA